MRRMTCVVTDPDEARRLIQMLRDAEAEAEGPAGESGESENERTAWAVEGGDRVVAGPVLV